MRRDVERNMRDSAHDFANIVWPAIADWCGGGELVACEDNESRTAQLVDRYAGIDYWQVQDAEGRMRGLASRIQYGSKVWCSFTVRSRRANGARTELEKRVAAIQQGWLVPTLTVQAYLSARGGSLLDVGLVYTTDLFKYLAEAERVTKANPDDGNEFVVAWWAGLQAAGYRVRTLGDEAVAA